MTDSRSKILAALSKNKPASTPLPIPEVSSEAESKDLIEVFSAVAVSIGSRVFRVQEYNEIEDILRKEFRAAKRIVSNITALQGLDTRNAMLSENDAHAFEDVDLAILKGELAVAENSAIWLAEDKMIHRVLPFICQHLALVIHQNDIVANLHEAYDRVESTEGGYGVFIAGPSKTADIEQSLVLGAHGPRSLWVFILS